MTNLMPEFNFEKLEVWKKTMVLVKAVYQNLTSFPKLENYGLTDQMRRAVTSILLNIAEGNGRYGNKEFIQFLYQARGSLFETVACLKLAEELKYLTPQQVVPLLQQTHEINRMLSGLINYLKKKTSQ
ncbi:four helix bundle protein [Candidatus Roizmanbacteria bacterium CG03_land_8_20_14_0_80_39_12]|uniref:Four helix bundle protein n=1 Tax=Candidatus Roizmanbacteria bacterium CG03_land_8_20_14_0_80_39_12 TaxID=1974847 RepID=A0A2M7BSC3_9BACT|nr:MAG: four helix bundle protein [Candidatus Roizmanbacteria bacterium CG03_land_8_20_14_0_80_39_12]